MIQRIQTVYYAVAVLLAAIPLTFPMIDLAGLSEAVAANAPAGETSSSLSAMLPAAKTGTVVISDGFWLTVATIATCSLLILLIITIVTFKWLRRQAFFGKITFWVYAGLIGYYLLLSYVIKLKVQVVDGAEVTWEGKMSVPLTFWFYVFAVGVVFVLLGNMGVRKDRRLLDSLNRLR